MKKHTTKQNIRKLREPEVLAAQGKSVAEICQAIEELRSVSRASILAVQSLREGMPLDVL